jgi:hypothetical protein
MSQFSKESDWRQNFFTLKFVPTPYGGVRGRLEDV